MARVRKDGSTGEAPGVPRGVLLVLFLLGAAVWGSTATFEFAFDDAGIAHRNVDVEEFDVRAILGSTLRAGSTAEEELGVEDFLYRPLPKLTFAANRFLFGDSPWSYHAANALLHLAAAALVLRLLRVLGHPPLVAAFAATFFLLHPVHVETVANVKHREEILAALGVIASWLYAVRAREASADRSSLRFALAASVAFFLALLSKESAISFLLLIPIADLAYRDARQAAWRRRGQLALALAGAAAVWLAVRSFVVGFAVTRGAEVFFLPDEGLLTRLLTSAKVWAAYYIGRGAILHDYPIGFSSRYEVAVESGFPSLQAWAGLVLLAASLAAAVVAWKSGARRGAFWTIFFWIALLPTSNLLVPIGTAGAYRLLYLPSLAWGVLLGAAASMVVSRIPRESRNVAAAIALLAPALFWAAISFAEARNWRDDASINASDLERTNNPRARFVEAMASKDPAGRARWLGETVRMMEALPAAARGMEVSVLARSLTELGALALGRGAVREAEALAEKALAALAVDRRFRRYEIFPLSILASAARARGDVPAEISLWERSREADPNYPRPYLELAEILARHGEREGAIAVLEEGAARIAASGFPELEADLRKIERAIEGLRRTVPP